jgi:hypothetical protein
MDADLQTTCNSVTSRANRGPDEHARRLKPGKTQGTGYPPPRAFGRSQVTGKAETFEGQYHSRKGQLPPTRADREAVRISGRATPFNF